VIFTKRKAVKSKRIMRIMKFSKPQNPHESKTTIPHLEITFLPIIQEGHREYALFRNLKKYPWVLEGKTNKNKKDLIQNIEKTNRCCRSKILRNQGSER
jgi:hypothetical protein